MDRKTLVKEIRRLVRKLEKSEGPLALMMLVSSDTTADDWNVIVSSRGLDRRSRAEGVRKMIELLRATLSEPMWPYIKGVTVLRTDDPFVKAMTSISRLRRGVEFDVVASNVAGVEIPRAIVFEAKRLAA